MRFGVVLPWWGYALAFGSAVVLGWQAYAGAVRLRTRPRAVLTALRITALLLLVALLLRPVVARRTSDGVVVPVLVDVSRSMALSDAGGRPRADVAAALVAQIQARLSGTARTEVWAIGDDVVPWRTPPPVASQSDLAHALQVMAAHYRGRPVPGMVLISDGADTGRIDPAAAAGLPSRVFPVGVGSPVIGRDREVLDVSAVPSALPGATVDVTATAVSRGYGRAPMDLRVLVNGRPVDVRRLADVDDGVPVRAVLTVAPVADGPTVVTIEVPADAEELTPGNNRRQLLIAPAGPVRRVLLVEGSPAHEHAFLRRALAADPALDVDVVARKGEDDRGRPTFVVQADGSRAAALARGFPADVPRLFAYDAVVLANVEPDLMARDDLEALAAFVDRRGGGVLALGARTLASGVLLSTPLSRVLPVTTGTARTEVSPAVAPGRLRPAVAPTRDGDVHPAVRLDADPAESRRRWAALPPLAAIHPVGRLSASASVLLVAADQLEGWRPLVVTDRAGEGRVALFAGEAAWRWRMTRPAADTTYETVWRQLVRWLATGSPSPVELAIAGALMPGRTTTVTVRVRDDRFEPVAEADAQLRVRGPDGTVRELRAVRVPSVPGTYAADMPVTEAGVYTATAEVRVPSHPLRTATQVWLAGGADQELADPRRNQDVLDRLARATGGRAFDHTDAAAVVDVLRESAAHTTLVTVELWHNVGVLVVLIGVLAAEWTLRRRWGMA